MFGTVRTVFLCTYINIFTLLCTIFIYLGCYIPVTEANRNCSCCNKLEFQLVESVGSGKSALFICNTIPIGVYSDMP